MWALCAFRVRLLWVWCGFIIKTTGKLPLPKPKPAWMLKTNFKMLKGCGYR
jgi:hypothetical protein